MNTSGIRATPRSSIRTILLWIVRVSAVPLLLFWGAFFVEHLSEWFLAADGRWPPAWVVAAQFLHLAMLLALAATIVWPRAGAAATIIATAAFFLWIGYSGSPLLPLANVVPAAFVLAATATSMATRGAKMG